MTEKILAVQRMQDYIALHLREDITLADLAREACYSPWYAAKIFREITGHAPADYIRKLRLAKSALRLRDERVRILDAALDMGFQSVDGYQRAFQREFGCNPAQYARNPIPLQLFTPYGAQYRQPKEEKIMDNIRNVFIQLTTRPARKVIIRRARTAQEYFTYCQEVGCDVWGLLTSMKSLCGEPVCLWLPEQYVRPGTSVYVQGVEVALGYDGPVPEGFDVIELPQAQYLLFQGEPFREEDFAQAIGEIWQAQERFDPARIGMQWDEENPKIQLEPRGERGYMDLKAVKPL